MTEIIQTPLINSNMPLIDTSSSISNTILPKNIITSNSSSFINKIKPYLFNYKTAIAIIIGILFYYMKKKYYTNKNITKNTSKNEDIELYDYIVIDKNNKLFKVSKDFFVRLNNSCNYESVSSSQLNNIINLNENKHIENKNKYNKNNENTENTEKYKDNVKNDDTSDIISDNIIYE